MHTIYIKGAIVANDEQWIYDFFEIEATCPRKVQDGLDAAKGQALQVLINSPGGEVFAGSEIYTMLREYKGNVTVKIIGLAASAASVVAMGGNRVLISPTAQLMIHNVSTTARGDYRSMEHVAQVLKNANTTIANAYRLKTKLSEKQLFALMDDETWFTADQALKLGFVDQVMFEDEDGSLDQWKDKLEQLRKQNVI